MSIPNGDRDSVLTEEQRHSFDTYGFTVFRNLISQEEMETLRQRADAIRAGKVPFPTSDPRRTRELPEGQSPPPKRESVAGLPEVKISPKYARKGYQVLPARQNEVDDATIKAAVDAEELWKDSGQVNYLSDYDEVFQKFSAQPKIVAVLQELIGPDVKLWYDHIFYKGPYGSANRYHQDGFFHMSEPPVTCWVALDDVTLENGCLRYIPKTTGYGKYDFDMLGDDITLKHLEQEVLLPMKSGDVAFHDRWAIHATGPNETPHRRRGIALHYGNARSKSTADITPDGRHWIGDKILGNLHWRLVSGREYPGCI